MFSQSCGHCSPGTLLGPTLGGEMNGNMLVFARIFTILEDLFCYLKKIHAKSLCNY